jgi:DNA end-binding protein Ku
MPRAIWKGQIAFGLVSVPVSLQTAEERKDISFKLLDSRDQARVRYERVNEVTGKEVPWDLVVKGYEIDKGKYVLIDEDELKKAVPESTQTVQIEDFVEEGAIGPIYFEKPYYLVPEKRGEKGYALLRETMRRTKRIGIARVVIRTKEYLAALMVSDDLLILDLLRFQEEIRDPSQYEVPSRNLEAAKLSKKEIDMAAKLVESMTVEWDPEKYKDEFRETLMDWLQKKADRGEEAEAPEPTDQEPVKKGRVIDFMELLRKSLGEKKEVTTARAERRSAKTVRKSAAPKAKARKRA